MKVKFFSWVKVEIKIICLPTHEHSIANPRAARQLKWYCRRCNAICDERHILPQEYVPVLQRLQVGWQEQGIFQLWIGSFKSAVFDPVHLVRRDPSTCRVKNRRKNLEALHQCTCASKEVLLSATIPLRVRGTVSLFLLIQEAVTRVSTVDSYHARLKCFLHAGTLSDEGHKVDHHSFKLRRRVRNQAGRHSAR